MTDGAVCYERVRLHGLDLSTKHVVIDSREPEIKKLARGEQCEGVAMSALRLKIPWLGFGSPGWIRTSDQLLRRQMLFPLSYRQIKSPRRLTSGLNSVGVFISPRSFAFDVRAYTNYASSKLVFKSFLQFSLFSMPSSAINVKKTAELNNSMHQRTRSIHCFSVKKGA